MIDEVPIIYFDGMVNSMAITEHFDIMIGSDEGKESSSLSRNFYRNFCIIICVILSETTKITPYQGLYQVDFDIGNCTALIQAWFCKIVMLFW